MRLRGLCRRPHLTGRHGIPLRVIPARPDSLGGSSRRHRSRSSLPFGRWRSRRRRSRSRFSGSCHESQCCASPGKASLRRVRSAAEDRDGAVVERRSQLALGRGRYLCPEKPYKTTDVESMAGSVGTPAWVGDFSVEMDEGMILPPWSSANSQAVPSTRMAQHRSGGNTPFARSRVHHEEIHARISGLLRR
jgi:hypothetical protein